MCSSAQVGALPIDLRWDFHRLLAWVWGQTAGGNSWPKAKNIQWKEFVPSHPYQGIFGKSSQGTFNQLKEARNPWTFWNLTQPLTDCELF